MNKQIWKSILALAGLTAILTLALAACGSDPTATPTPRPAATATPTPAPVEKPTLIFSDLDWNSAQIQNAIVRKIAELGYGYETDAVFGGTIPLMEALTAGDTHITMEIWLPNQLEAWAAIYQDGNGEVEVLGKSLEDNWQSSFIIPQYTKDANPDLTSVEDLKNSEYMELFVTPESDGKARMLHCIPGWECEGINLQKVKSYGLADFVEPINPGSTAALDAEILGAYEKEEDILFYYWGPTSLINKLNTEYSGYYILEEPAHSDECAATDWACAYPVSEIFIAMRKEMVEMAPDVAEMLRNWDFNAANSIAADTYVADSGADFPEVAEWWLQNTEEWKEWVAPGVADRVLAAL